MKTINNIRQVLPVLLFSTLLFSTTTISAQNRWKKDKTERGKNEYRERDDYETRNYDKMGHTDQDYAYRNDERNDDKIIYHSGHHSRNKHESRYFEHPRYGRVYERFSCDPIVFYNNRGNYYYYGDQFYTYRRGIGYCVVDPPRNVYFRTLPAECERIFVNGNIFFRRGDLYFQLSPRGYSIVNSPFQVRISACF